MTLGRPKLTHSVAARSPTGRHRVSSTVAVGGAEAPTVHPEVRLRLFTPRAAGSTAYACGPSHSRSQSLCARCRWRRAETDVAQRKDGRCRRYNLCERRSSERRSEAQGFSADLSELDPEKDKALWLLFGSQLKAD